MCTRNTYQNSLNAKTHPDSSLPSPIPPRTPKLPSHGPSFAVSISRVLSLTEYISSHLSPSFASSISPSPFFTSTFCTFLLGNFTLLSFDFYHGANTSRICFWKLAGNSRKGESLSALQVNISLIDHIRATHEH